MPWPSATRARSQRVLLVGQRHQRAVGGGARRTPGLDEQHEREQAQHLRLVGHELDQEPAEADRFGAEVLADQPVARTRRVALGEDEVDDGQHGAQPVGQLGLVRHPVGDPRVADLALGPDNPLRHRRLGHQEGAGDLARGEPAEQPQRERHLRARRERRMAAGEDQPEPIVVHGALLGHVVVGAVEQDGLGVPLLP